MLTRRGTDLHEALHPRPSLGPGADYQSNSGRPDDGRVDQRIGGACQKAGLVYHPLRGRSHDFGTV